MRKLDIMSESPKLFIFHGNSNKTKFGGILSFIFMIGMLFISLAYILDYILNDKYKIEYSLIYEYMTPQKRIDKNSNPKLCPTIDFGFELKDMHDNILSDNFVIFDMNYEQFIDRNFSLIKRNVSELSIGIFYNCSHDEQCLIREEDETDINYKMIMKYRGFFLDHQRKDVPLFDNNSFFEESFPFFFEKTEIGSLNWRNIIYKEEKGLSRLFYEMIGLEDEYIKGFVEDYLLYTLDHSSGQEIDGYFYRFLGIISMENNHSNYIEYKRKKIGVLNILANIGSLFLSIKSFCIIMFGFYSKNFDNYKIIEKILNNNSKLKLPKNLKNSKEIELVNDINNKSSSLVNEESNENKLIINDDNPENDSETNYKESKIILPKLNFFDFFYNNLYSKNCCNSNKQELISICNEIVLKYISIEYILFNQIKLENLLKDYKWNNPKLNLIENNKLIDQFKQYI